MLIGFVHTVFTVGKRELMTCLKLVVEENSFALVATWEKFLKKRKIAFSRCSLI